MKTILMIVAALALAGCTHKAKPAEASPAPLPADMAAYIEPLGKAVKSELYDWDKWKGNACTVRISVSDTGEINGVRSDGGNPAFCAYAIESIRRVKLPKATPAVYAQLNHVPLDLKP